MTLNFSSMWEKHNLLSSLWYVYRVKLFSAQYNFYPKEGGKLLFYETATGLNWLFFF